VGSAKSVGGAGPALAPSAINGTPSTTTLGQPSVQNPNSPRAADIARSIGEAGVLLDLPGFIISELADKSGVPVPTPVEDLARFAEGLKKLLASRPDFLDTARQAFNDFANAFVEALNDDPPRSEAWVKSQVTLLHEWREHQGFQRHGGFPVENALAMGHTRLANTALAAGLNLSGLTLSDAAKRAKHFNQHVTHCLRATLACVGRFHEPDWDIVGRGAQVDGLVLLESELAQLFSNQYIQSTAHGKFLAMGRAAAPPERQAAALDLRLTLHADLVESMTRVAAGRYPLSREAISKVAEQVVSRADAIYGPAQGLRDKPNFSIMGVEALLLDDSGWDLVNAFARKIGHPAEVSWAIDWSGEARRSHGKWGADGPTPLGQLICALQTARSPNPDPTLDPAQLEPPSQGLRADKIELRQRAHQARQALLPQIQEDVRQLFATVSVVGGVGMINLQAWHGERAARTVNELSPLAFQALARIARARGAREIYLVLPRFSGRDGGKGSGHASVPVINKAVEGIPDLKSVSISAGFPGANQVVTTDLTGIVKPVPVTLCIKESEGTRSVMVLTGDDLDVQAEVNPELRHVHTMQVRRPAKEGGEPQLDPLPFVG
jgi:hypothetical protein